MIKLLLLVVTYNNAINLAYVLVMQGAAFECSSILIRKKDITQNSISFTFWVYRYSKFNLCFV